MDKGDGSADVYTDLWMPNREAIWKKYVDGAKTVGHNKPYLGTQMMYVPSYMAGKVKTVDDLKRPEIAAMFDTDGDGLGEYWPGDVTWASTKRRAGSSTSPSRKGVISAVRTPSNMASPRT